MMVSSNSDPSKESLQIRQDTKFYTKLLSKESSLANPSFRVYYGVATGAVPFLWESQPGTPKNKIHTPTLPPLTPPPSYQLNFHNSKSAKKHSKRHNYLISTLLPKLALGRSHTPPPTPPSLSSSTTSSSSSSSYPSACHRRAPFSKPRWSLSSRAYDDDSDDDASPTSTPCFRLRHRAVGGLRGCYAVVGH